MRPSSVFCVKQKCSNFDSDARAGNSGGTREPGFQKNLVSQKV